MSHVEMEVVMILYGINPDQMIPTSQALRQKGKEARSIITFKDQGKFTPVTRDVNKMINKQNETRIPELHDLRRERMSVSPFTFYRGTALIMAHDLSQQAISGSQLIICGDAHINNFGLYASPERRLVFDLNDFDEAAPGPWEWDLKRLITSIILCGEELGLRDDQVKEIATKAAMHYRLGLRKVLELSSMKRYSVSIGEEDILDKVSSKSEESFKKVIKKAKKRDSEQVISKMTQEDSYGRRVFIENPPVLTHMEPGPAGSVEESFEAYKKTVRPDIEMLLSQHILTDLARRVVGVGSVGTRCFLLVLTCENSSHLVLQIKEASQSVVTAYNPIIGSPLQSWRTISDNGRRVCDYQQILQAYSDPFLGHFQSKGTDYYVRQFRDMKGSFEMNELNHDGFLQYVEGCALLLSRAHAQSPNANWVAGYMGKTDAFEQEIVKWCISYSRQVYRDYEVFVK
ncbi:MAG: DUF2252 domain-containing protein [Firmicutes bacterium HGW-Firmicutes-4]|jgi:uncharacterized protein (DUF2252 family)|nr:MAG: DUF2252 domain-containing protein [Firmicutes bacterium HGW-Firmicutes-4]